MKMFLFKSLFLASLMFLSVLFGMQQANIGIQKMKGYDDPKFKSALTIDSSEEGELQASVLGVSHDLEEKKRKLEEIKAYNLFSDIGKTISNGISGGLNKLFNTLSNE